MPVIFDLQTRLNIKGAGLDPDNSWGPLTGQRLAEAILAKTLDDFDLAPVRAYVAQLAPRPADLQAYYGLTDAMVDPDPRRRGAVVLKPGIDWREKRTAVYTLAGGHTVRLNKRAAGAFLAAFAELDVEASRRRVWWPHDVQSFCLRRKMWDPSRNLSEHAQGAAIDIDPDKNPYGDKPGEIATVAMWAVEILEAWGIAWGGRWKPGSRDDMHFELVRR